MLLLSHDCRRQFRKREKVIQENYVFRYSRIVRKTFPITLGKLFWLVWYSMENLLRNWKQLTFSLRLLRCASGMLIKGHIWMSSQACLWIHLTSLCHIFETWLSIDSKPFQGLWKVPCRWRSAGVTRHGVSLPCWAPIKMEEMWKWPPISHTLSEAGWDVRHVLDHFL